MRRLLLTCGILSSFVYAAMLIVIPLQWPAYHSASQTVSELSAIDAPTRSFWRIAALFWTLLYVAFGLGVWQSASTKRSLRMAGGAIMLAGVVGLFWPPMHQREVLAAGGGSLTDTLHLAWTAANGILTLLAMGFGAAALGKRFRIYSIATMVVLLAAGALTSIDAPRVNANLATPWIGIWERVNIGAWLCWVVVLGAMLLRDTAHATVTDRSSRPREERELWTIDTVIKRYSLLIYFGLVFLISWGGAFLVLGPGALPPSAQEFENLGGLFYLAILAGPSVAGVLLTRLVDGRPGLRDLLGRLGRWPASPKWYAVALLPALAMTAAPILLSLVSSDFRPAILDSSDKAGILMRALVPALLVGSFEEIGWSGFAVPYLRARYSMLATGLGVGVVWGAWHLPLFWKPDSFSATLPLTILLVQLFSWLPPFRVVLVWIHDRTQSLPAVMLAHALVSLNAIILSPVTLTGARLLASLLASAAMMWILMVAVGMANRGALSRQPLRRSLD